MLRLSFIALLVATMSQSTYAIVEMAEFQVTHISEKEAAVAPRCIGKGPHHGFGQDSQPLITTLEDCGRSKTSSFTTGTTGNLRLFDANVTNYGTTTALFSRRHPLPLGGLEQPRQGVGTVASVRMIPWHGAADVSTSMSLVERLSERFGSSEPAILSLDIRAENLDRFSHANVSVFDHDTNELLLSWNGEPMEPNNGSWFSQELDFGDRVGHAIRFEFEADGRSTHGTSSLAAAVYLNVPEPTGLAMVVPIVFALAALRVKRPRHH